MTRLIGVAFDADRSRDLLAPLGFTVEGDGPRIEVIVPPSRLDVAAEADVAEELARTHGYDRIEGRLPQAALPPWRPDPSGPRNGVRRILAGLGLDEVVSHALIGEDDLERTGYDPRAAELIRLYNPLSAEHSILRPVLYPSLLGAIAENARRRRPDAWLFEVGKVYWHHPDGPTARERTPVRRPGRGRYESWELGIVLAGAAAPATPGDPARVGDVAS